MEPLTIPPSPNWYETKIAVCAPDNTLIYGAKNSIVVVKSAPAEMPSDMSVISFAHLDKITCLAMAPTWNEQHKVVASCADDKLVKVWNMLDNTCTYSHKTHLASKSRLVGVGFISNVKIVSVAEDGLILVWKMATSQVTVHKNLLGLKVHVTAISTCPHAGWLTAFGMRNGLVVVTDLKGHGGVLYKLRAHEREVVDFTWCPTPINVIPDLDQKQSGDKEESLEEKKPELIGEQAGGGNEADSAVDTQDTIDAKPVNSTHIHCAIEFQAQSEELQAIRGPVTTFDPISLDDDSILQEPEKDVSTAQDPSTSKVIPKAPTNVRKNPWANIKHADDDEIPPEPEPVVKEDLDTSDEFLKECLALKARIIATKDEEISLTEISNEGYFETQPRPLLHANRRKRIKGEKTIDAAGDGPASDIISDLVSSDTVSTEESQKSKLVTTADTTVSSKEEFLLASSARGGHIVIWRAGTDGRVQRRMRIAKPKGRGCQSRTSNNTWVSMHWISPDRLLTSGLSGELMAWRVTDQMPTPTLIHNDHEKQLFCITSPFCHERGVYSKWEDVAAWTMGQDRSILYTLMHSRKVLACYPTFAYVVYVSAASPITPTRVAFGVSDGFIRIWDLSKENKQFIQMTHVKIKVGAKILSLAWHTSQEYLLAFGTEDGQCGYVNSGQCKKPPVYFAQQFLTAVYKLEWAPVPDKSAEKLYLYCCAEGQLVVYNFDHPLVSPAIVKIPKGERVTNFAWKSDYSKLAIGCKSGTVYILNSKYEVNSTLYYQKKSIGSMAWHPMQTAEDEELSPNHDWIATATSSDTTVAIFDVSKVTDDFCMKEVIAGELFGHVKNINVVFWSPYKNGTLATASHDGTVTVWSGINPVSTFVNNNAEPVLTGMWSPLHEDIIISSGMDRSIRVWNLKNHPTKEQKDLANARSTRRKNLTHYRTRMEESELQVNKSKRFPLLGDISARQAHLETATADCRVLFEHGHGKEVDENNLILRLFGDPINMTEILDTQKDAHRHKNRNGLLNYLQMWTGKLGETIKKAITGGNVTPWLLSVAPMISFSLWQEAVEAYASQLADSTLSNPVEIASYYLALHKVDEAIDILSAKQMHREALVLAKFKKPDDTDLHKYILTEWSRECVMSGRFEIAAQGFLAQGLYEEAAKVLYRRNDLPSLVLAIELARFCGNDTLANTIQYRHDALQAQDDKMQLPSRMELEVKKAQQSAKAEQQSERSAQEVEDIDIANGNAIDKNSDSSNNENGNGHIHIADRINDGEEKTVESDYREVDAAGREAAKIAKSNDIADDTDNHVEGMNKTASDCTEDVMPCGN